MMAYTPTTWVNGTSPFLNATNLNKLEQGVAAAHDLIPGGAAATEYDLPLSSFSGASDDAKLTAAMSYAAAQTYSGGTIVLDENRQYSFSTKQPLYTGFSIRGSARATDQLRSGDPTSNEIRVRTSGGWFYLNQSQTFSCAFQGLSIDGTATTCLIDGHASNVLWTSVFRDITSVNAGSVIGTPSQRLLVTAGGIDGFWNINNSQNSALNIGGSDYRIRPTQMLVDTGGLMSKTEYAVTFSYLSNTGISDFYMTAEGHRAILLEGGSSAGDVRIRDCEFEGRNAGAPSPGTLMRVTGGQYLIDGCRFAFAMTSPDAADDGVIQVEGGSVTFRDCTYSRATGVAESVPFMRVTGGKVRIRDVVGNGSWSGKPVVSTTSASLVDADSSVTVVTD